MNEQQQQQYENALLWIRTIAGMHYFGGAFNPEHMRALANLASDALDGRDIPDFHERMAKAQKRARKWADQLGAEIVDNGDNDDWDKDSA